MENFKCNCPNCGQEIRVDESLIGVKFACPTCSLPVCVQAVSGEQPASPAPVHSAPKECQPDTPPSALKVKLPGQPAVSSKVKPPAAKSPVLKPKKTEPVSPLSPPPPSSSPSLTLVQEESAASSGTTGDQRTPKLLKIIAVILGLTVVILAVFLWIFCCNQTGEYRYKVVTVDVEKGSAAYGGDEEHAHYSISAIAIENHLRSYGDWELVDVIEEIETVHPNFGNDQYVTGLQPNVRICKIHLVLRQRD